MFKDLQIGDVFGLVDEEGKWRDDLPLYRKTGEHSAEPFEDYDLGAGDLGYILDEIEVILILYH